jgi:hypothetical protein
MKNMYRIKAFSVMGWWIVASLLIWPLAAIILGIIMLPLAMVFSIFEPSYRADTYQLYQSIGMILAMPLVGAIIAWSMSVLQRWLLRRKLYWAADKWRRWSIIGGAVGAYAVALPLFFIRSGDDIYVALMMPIFIAVVSAFQFLSLRHAVKDAWLWILGNIVAGMVFSGLLLSNRRSYEPDFGVVMLAGASLGVITGYVMLFLFEKKLLPMKPEDDSTPVDPNRPKSVWDEVV